MRDVLAHHLALGIFHEIGATVVYWTPWPVDVGEAFGQLSPRPVFFAFGHFNTPRISFSVASSSSSQLLLDPRRNLRRHVPKVACAAARDRLLQWARVLENEAELALEPARLGSVDTIHKVDHADNGTSCRIAKRIRQRVNSQQRAIADQKHAVRPLVARHSLRGVDGERPTEACPPVAVFDILAGVED